MRTAQTCAIRSAPPGGEATAFTDAERAALELTEEGTRIADGAGGVPDEVWRNAEKHDDERALTALVSLIAMINAFNRFNVITRQLRRRAVRLSRPGLLHQAGALVVGRQVGHRHRTPAHAGDAEEPVLQR